MALGRNERRSMEKSPHARNQSQKWEFIKQLSHQLIRDIAFAVTCPSILFDSDELPMVDFEMLNGAGNKWQSFANWLKELNIDEVIEWFGAHRNTRRLGNHFALCVEYILRFSPVIQAKKLVVSQQVLQRVVSDSFSLEVAGTFRGHEVVYLHDLYGKRKQALNVVILASAKEVVISCLQQQCLSNHSEDFVKASSSKLQEPVAVTSFLEEETSVPCIGIKVPCKEVPQEFKGGMRNSNELDNKRSVEGYKGLGKRNKKSLQKLKMKNGKEITHTLGEFDFLFQAEDAEEQMRDIENSIGLCWLNMSSNVNANGDIYSQLNTRRSNEIYVQHWEVSVKFLLYAGPWELFGLITPSDATWRRVQQSCNIKNYVESGSFNVINQFPSEPRNQKTIESMVKDVQQMNVLACFLGPHFGETLFDRKSRLRNQLMLSHNKHAAAFVYQLFTGALVNDLSTVPLVSCSGACALCQRELESLKDAAFSHVSEYACYIQNEDLDLTTCCCCMESKFPEPRCVRLYPRALLKGYLFYEYELWRSLMLQRNIGSSSYPFGIENVDHKLCIGNNMQYEGDSPLNFDNKIQRNLKDVLKESKLNLEHWMGWWTHISTFSKFALSWHHQNSMWYIVPKKEWLSPVIINKTDKHRCSHVVDVANLLKIAAGVREEAEMKKVPRKHRFMVVELTETCNNLSGEHGQELNSEGVVWMEVSRGFVVEDTWPDTKTYAPHGYVMP